MSFLTIFLLCVAFVLCFLQYLLFYTSKGRLFNKIPGPNRLPIIGNVMNFFVSPVEMFGIPRKFSKQFKNVNGVQIVQTRVVNVYNPNDTEIILSSSKYITKGRIYNFLHPWLQQGLLTSKGEKWHQRRKILTPAFHFNILKQFCKSFIEQSQNLIEDLKSQKNETVDVIPIVTQFALHSICETAMGTKVKSEDVNFNRYKRAVYDMGHLVFERLIRFWIHPDFLFRLTEIYAKQIKTLSILHGFTTSVIRQRRKERQSGNGVQIISHEDIETDDYIKSNKKRLAMLDLLLSAEAEGKIDETGIREEVDTFMFEGHDTTAMAISFALMILANHKDVQDRIAEELHDIYFEDPERLTTMDDLNKMKYLEMCIKESLRLFPSVPFISRVLEEDLQLTDYLIPSGTTCHLHIYDLHRDPSIYPSPEEFIPERFTLENSSKRHPYAYVPFSAGPRNCIGQKFAMYEMKSVISSILKNFILEPVTTPKDIVFVADLVLRSANPIYVKFVPRVIN